MDSKDGPAIYYPLPTILGGGRKVSDGVSNYSLTLRNHHLQLNHYPVFKGERSASPFFVFTARLLAKIIVVQYILKLNRAC